MNTAKYIIFEGKNAVVFSYLIKHSDIASGSNLGRPTSAGFVTIEDGKVETFGESLSLLLVSRIEDAAIIQNQILWINGNK
jgi:hypothetical protein